LNSLIVSRVDRIRIWKNLRWIGIAAALCLVAGFLYRHQKLMLEPDHIALPADGVEHVVIRIRFAGPRWLDLDNTVRQREEDTLKLRLLPSKDNAGRTIIDGIVQAPVTPGAYQVHLAWHGRAVRVPVKFALDVNDNFSDGTPNFLRLHTTQDRKAFREWFISIAEAQADTAPGKLPNEISDCAALLRYAYREALHAHDEPWLRAHPTDTPPPSVHQYIYPQTPLGANLFRVRPGAFLAADLADGTFAQFADARSLMQDNTFLVGRNLAEARPGDLIFYRQLDQDTPYDVPDTHRYHSPFHSMIVGEKGNSVVYHTGPIEHGKGEMRRLRMSDLIHHPDARWRPVNENANFLGVYRWNILREGD
jgi:uncharacterized protein